MPYRAAIDSVIGRCDELRARIERLQHRPVFVECCDSIDEALAWEARLRELVATLEAARAAEDDSMATVHDPTDARAWHPPRPSMIHGVVAAALVLTTIIVFLVQLR